MVAAGEEDERAGRCTQGPTERQDAPDEDQMITGLVHGVALALETRQDAGYQRHSGDAGDRLEPRPVAASRSREPRRDLILSLAEHAHAPRVAASQEAMDNRT